MKLNIKYILSGILVALLFPSCDLTREPEDTLSPESYFASSAQLELWTNGFYTQFDNA